MRTPHWINPRALLLLHAESLAEHGSFIGMRDENGCHSAMARPEHLFAYEPRVNLSRLAAAYGFGLIRNYPFTDGNKRAELLAILLFLDLNGLELNVEQVEAVQAIFEVAAGRVSESKFAEWIRQHTRRAAIR